MGVWEWQGGTGLGRFQECGRARLAETCPAWRQSPLYLPPDNTPHPSLYKRSLKRVR